MKNFFKTALFLTALIIGCSAMAFAKTPPGTVKIGENLYFDKTPVSIIAWQEYVFWTAKEYGKNSVEYASALPDSTIFRATYGFAFDKYQRDKEKCPIVGVTAEQRAAYCEWRTKIVRQTQRGNVVYTPATDEELAAARKSGKARKIVFPENKEGDSEFSCVARY